MHFVSDLMTSMWRGRFDVNCRMNKNGVDVRQDLKRIKLKYSKKHRLLLCSSAMGVLKFDIADEWKIWSG